MLLDQKKNNWWVYIIKCQNNVLITGISMDVDEEFNKHNLNDKKSIGTNGRLGPLKLVYKSKPFKNKSLASREEWKINRMSKDEKLKFINN